MVVHNIPKGATHVWTPAVQKPFPYHWVFRRAYYKKVNGAWYSYTIDDRWVQSGNDSEWFNKEKKLGYFVTINKFTKPGFVPVKEDVNA